MRKLLTILLTVCFAFLLPGCGEKEETEDVTRLQLKKNGEVVHTIVEDFSESYYDLEELKNEIQTQADAYNAGTEKVKLNSAELEDGRVRVVMTFQKPEDYAGFYRQALFCGTVKQAFEAGYDLNVELASADPEGAGITKAEILDMGERHIVIFREAVKVIPYGEILYASSDVTVSDNGKEAVSSSGEMLSYIIFK